MAISHLIIEQTSTPETVSAAVIEKLAEIARGNLDASSKLSGIINAITAYRDSCEFLVNKFSPNLGINVPSGNYLVVFDNNQYKILCQNAFNSGGAITEGIAQNVTNNAFGTLLASVLSDAQLYIDLKVFPNVSNIPFYNDSRGASRLHDAVIDGLDLGNIIYLKDTYIHGGYGYRPIANVKMNTLVGENVKVVGSYTFGDTYFTELYLPNVEVIGAAQGNHSGTATINGVSYNWMREFVFLGDKLKAWQHMSTSASQQDKAVYVITAPVPPKFVTFTDNSDDYTENTSFMENNIWKYQRINFYVPDAVLETYRTATNWSTMWSRWENILPISSLSATYKQKISKWYTEPTNE